MTQYSTLLHTTHNASPSPEQIGLLWLAGCESRTHSGLQCLWAVRALSHCGGRRSGQLVMAAVQTGPGGAVQVGSGPTEIWAMANQHQMGSRVRTPGLISEAEDRVVRADHQGGQRV